MKKTIGFMLAVLFLFNPNIASAKKYYFHEDHLGGASIMTDEDGEIVAEYQYYPYGGTYSEETSGEDFGNSYKYTGQEEDAEIGLYYYGSRYYNPEVTKFMSQDPAVYDERFLEMLRDPQSFNTYAYVRNNPIKYIDPSGEEPNKAQAGTVGDVWNSMLPTSYSYQASNSAVINKFLNAYNNNAINGSTIRYVYTTKAGWVDMRHFFYFADKSYEYGGPISVFGAYGSEAYQWLGVEIDKANGGIDFHLGGNPSAFSYEDITSDRLGIMFGQFAKEMEGENYSFEELLNNFFTSLGATDPENANNYEDIPENSSTANKKNYNEVDKSN